MRLPPRFHLVIDGDTFRVNERANAAPDQLPYLLDRLLRGQPVADEALTPFGLRVFVEPDMDQG